MSNTLYYVNIDYLVYICIDYKIKPEYVPLHVGFINNIDVLISYKSIAAVTR